jgi:hypothetical protein
MEPRMSLHATDFVVHWSATCQFVKKTIQLNRTVMILISWTVRTRGSQVTFKLVRRSRYNFLRPEDGFKTRLSRKVWSRGSCRLSNGNDSIRSQPSLLECLMMRRCTFQQFLGYFSDLRITRPAARLANRRRTAIHWLILRMKITNETACSAEETYPLRQYRSSMGALFLNRSRRQLFQALSFF